MLHTSYFILLRRNDRAIHPLKRISSCVVCQSMTSLDEIIKASHETARSVCGSHGSAASRMRSICGLESYVNAFDRLAIVSATDIKGTIVYVNEQFTGISGYSEAELIGQNHRILN